MPDTSTDTSATETSETTPASSSAIDATAEPSGWESNSADVALKTVGTRTFDERFPPSETGTVVHPGTSRHEHIFVEDARSRVTTDTGEYMLDACRCGAWRYGRQVGQAGY